MTTKINLSLSVEQTNQLLSLLGDQPIKSGLTDLTTLIKSQGDAQLQAATQAVEKIEATDVEIVN